MRRYILVPLAVLLAASQPATAAPGDETEHTVEPGETLNGIANRAGVPSNRIIEANRLEPPYVIRIGQKLAIPRDGRPASRTIAARMPAAASASPLETRTVEPGDTLLGIALAEKVPLGLLAEANGLSAPYVIKVGQKLIIPRTRRHTIEQGDTGFSLSYRYAVPWKDIAVANGIEPSAPLRIGQDLLIPTVLDRPSSSAFTPKSFVWPLSGNIRRAWRPRGAADYHDGLDIEAPKGSAVRATAPGTVIFADQEKSQFGYLVVIDHGNGWHSAYGSLERVTVKKGEQVKQGERVGLVGDTSVTRRTELHFELRKDGKPVDPLAELPETE